jgi:hypothetical protein
MKEVWVVQLSDFGYYGDDCCYENHVFNTSLEATEFAYKRDKISWPNYVINKAQYHDLQVPTV